MVHGSQAQGSYIICETGDRMSFAHILVLFIYMRYQERGSSEGYMLLAKEREVSNSNSN